MTEYVLKKGDEFCGIAYTFLENGRDPFSGQPRKDFESEEFEILSLEEYDRKIDEYRCLICGNWKEVSEKRYDDQLSILPPVKWENDGFFISEPHILDVHSFYQKHNGKFYGAMFRISTNRDAILKSLEDFLTNISINHNEKAGMSVDAIIGSEKLIEKINEPIIQLRNELKGKGYTEREVDRAIAGALPNCIASAVIHWSEKGGRLESAGS
jgi:hypothetical protein